MIPTYYLLIFTIFSLLCKRTIQTQKLTSLFVESNDCKCGRRNDLGFRIVGGREAEPDYYPWMAAIYSKLYEKIFCGGSLINDRYVVTAGHCLKWTFKESLSVILGLHDKLLLEEKSQGLMFEIENILKHENFSSLSFYDIEDIALIKLKKAVKFSEKIQPVCLPKDTGEDYANKVAQVIGWGKISYSAESSRYLREANVSVISKENCQNHKRIGHYILDSMLCAYGNKTDACQGDSGGPLTYETSSGRVELIGVVSWGIGCAQPQMPGVYTRITSYIDWIAKHTTDAVYCKNT